ncbi:unnamed protein product [Calypogeia fissa]
MTLIGRRRDVQEIANAAPIHTSKTLTSETRRHCTPRQIVNGFTTQCRQAGEDLHIEDALNGGGSLLKPSSASKSQELLTQVSGEEYTTRTLLTQQSGSYVLLCAPRIGPHPPEHSALHDLRNTHKKIHRQPSTDPTELPLLLLTPLAAVVPFLSVYLWPSGPPLLRRQV